MERSDSIRTLNSTKWRLASDERILCSLCTKGTSGIAAPKAIAAVVASRNEQDFILESSLPQTGFFKIGVLRTAVRKGMKMRVIVQVAESWLTDSTSRGMDD